MKRGTTPTYYFELEEVNVADITYALVTAKQDSLKVLKSTNDGDITFDAEKNQVVVSYTQEETLKFKSRGRVGFDIRGLCGETAWATDTYFEEVDDVQQGGVIPLV